MQEKRYSLWDMPTRIFHWLILCCVPLAWWSAETENYDIHQWLGYTVLVLVSGRIVWGFVGSAHSRFSDFVVGPRKTLAYMRGLGSDSAGHNPLGAWSVLALLLLLLLQAVSGLFNSDDVFFSGPLYYAADARLRGLMGELHGLAFDGLLFMVGLHIAAVLYHQLRLKEKLLQAMFRGYTPQRPGRAAPVSAWWALLVVLLLGLALWSGLEQAPQPAPMRW